LQHRKRADWLYCRKKLLASGRLRDSMYLNDMMTARGTKRISRAANTVHANTIETLSENHNRIVAELKNQMALLHGDDSSVRLKMVKLNGLSKSGTV
jgi:hypothetical protein